jgi:flagellar biosynthesis protein FlhF
MKLKTYRAATLKAALEQIKRELGSDAFILSQKEVRPSKLLGVIRRSYVEVTAAMDYVQTESQEANPVSDPAETISDRVELSGNSDGAERECDAPSLPEPSVESFPENHVLLEEIRNLKSMVQSMSSDRQRETIWLKPRHFSTPAAKQAYSDLRARGIEGNLAFNLASNPDIASTSQEDFLGAIASVLSSRIRIHSDLVISRENSSPQVVALIGPTGVGKTTTLAKIAARAALQDGLKVGLVTLDTFRIAAIEQLKTYSEIIGVPVRVVETVRQMKAAIQSYSDRDLVLIDTTGRSQHEVANESELAEFFSQSVDIQKALVLSATTKQSDLRTIVEKYEIFGTNCLIFTKLDETDLHGPIINELVRSGKPLSYVTIGQGVPQDILRPDQEQIVELAIGSNSSSNWKLLIDADRTQQTARSCAQGINN